MGFNIWQMMSELHLGLDILPETDWETIPHARNAAHTPKYELWISQDGEDWEPFYEAGSDLDEMVEYAHWGAGIEGAFKLTEDGYPVFTRS